jgi:hypothetical protein
MKEPLRKLIIDLSELELAFDSSSLEMSWYLDLETGEVVMVSAETIQELEQIYAEYVDEEAERIDLAAILAELDYPDWQKEELIKVDPIEQDSGEHYLRIPETDSHAGWQDMQEFIDTVNNPRLQERLERAIHGRGPFGSFKDALLSFPKERERWFQFKNDRSRQRVLDWLEAEGIEPVDHKV